MHVCHDVLRSLLLIANAVHGPQNARANMHLRASTACTWTPSLIMCARLSQHSLDALHCLYLDSQPDYVSALLTSLPSCSDLPCCPYSVDSARCPGPRSPGPCSRCPGPRSPGPCSRCPGPRSCCSRFVNMPVPLLCLDVMTAVSA